MDGLLSILEATQEIYSIEMHAHACSKWRYFLVKAYIRRYPHTDVETHSISLHLSIYLFSYLCLYLSMSISIYVLLSMYIHIIGKSSAEEGVRKTNEGELFLSRLHHRDEEDQMRSLFLLFSLCLFSLSLSV